ncbi:MAG: hypothetical protein M1819_003209 [Sarea resinae]|nr:MAG: hypothetical protein M1819_003209 [Sarea resinae]
MTLTSFLCVALGVTGMAVPALAQSKAVFAHFIVGNSAGSTYDDWVDDVTKAKAAGIDGFALNIAATDTYTDTSLENAYNAANSVGDFSCFLSFDYQSEGAWDASTVADKINTYSGYPAQYNYTDNQPLVSTFEGGDNAGDWATIKSQTNCFFMPEWSNLGVSTAASESSIDGLFSWAAWPDGASDMTTSTDQDYVNALDGKPYMMPVSPWFYTNLPQWNKNWLWRGDDLWHDRWQQVIDLQPQLVEIITWNDYGESHYIGPIRSAGIPSGASWYVSGNPHDAWRTVLPFYIAQYKNDNASMPAISTESVTAWYRLNPASSGSANGTTGNTASQGQTTVDPGTVDVDAVFVSALVATLPATVAVSIGSVQVANWTVEFEGVSHWSVAFGSNTGDVSVVLERSGSQVAIVNGAAITTDCTNGNVNWNAWVGDST